MKEMALLRRVCRAYQAILGDKLTGFYIHGSIAFGCFTWETGDIDFLCVVRAPLTQPEKEALIHTLLDLTPEAPPKGFEMSIMLQEHCKPFCYPTPYELHFSNAYKARAQAELAAYCRDMHGDDPDLAAHITVLHHVGFALLGADVRSTFAPVPRACYLDSILKDVDGAAEEIAASPVYLTLNLCRVLAYLADGAILSKQQGGQWGLAHLPGAFHPLLRSALHAYAAGAPLTETSQLTDFAADMLARIHAYL